MHALNEIALERCDTAVCAIKLMGELGEKYGFYGPGIYCSVVPTNRILTIYSSWMCYLK